MPVSLTSSMERRPRFKRDCGRPWCQRIVKSSQRNQEISFSEVVHITSLSSSFLLFYTINHFTMPASVQTPKRKLDSVDASSAASTASKHLKLSITSTTPTISTTSISPPSSSSSTQAKPQPKPSAWSQGGNASKVLFSTASQGPAKPLVSTAAQPKPATAALPQSSVWGQTTKPAVAVPLTKTAATAIDPVSPQVVAPIAKPATTLFKVDSTLNPSCPVLQPASPGENLIAFRQQVQPSRSISPASSGNSNSFSSTGASSTSWRSRSSATSQSSWRSGTSGATPAAAPAQPRISALQVGQICFLPAQADIAIEEPIHSHPDFVNNSKAFVHPCVVVDGTDAKGYFTCFQLTSFGQYQGLLDKYSDKIDRCGQPRSMASQRMRWLLIECDGAKPNHDNLPILHYDSPRSARMQKCTYVNCETWFKIRASDLVVQGRVKKLSGSSVQAAWRHHNEVLEKSYGVMSKALINCPGLMP